jgi:hypothetical protein
LPSQALDTRPPPPSSPSARAWIAVPAEAAALAGLAPHPTKRPVERLSKDQRRTRRGQARPLRLIENGKKPIVVDFRLELTRDFH